MTYDEVSAELTTAEYVEEHGHRNPYDESDGYVVTLYKAANGRHFCVVAAAGMNASLPGAGIVGEWLSDAEADSSDWYRL